VGSHYRDDTKYFFFHKKITVTCKENLGDANEYWKLLEPPPKPKKTINPKKSELVCGQCKKIGHTKKHCHWNLENPNN
jgi:hypothetical protein